MSAVCSITSPDDALIEKRQRFMKPNGEVKRPRNMFMCYRSEQREKLTKEHPNLHQSEICSLLGKNWKKLSEEEKEKYKYMAAIDHADHLKLFPGYKYQPKIKIQKGKVDKVKKSKQAQIKKSKPLQNEKKVKTELLRQALLKGKESFQKEEKNLASKSPDEDVLTTSNSLVCEDLEGYTIPQSEWSLNVSCVSMLCTPHLSDLDCDAQFVLTNEEESDAQVNFSGIRGEIHIPPISSTSHDLMEDFDVDFSPLTSNDPSSDDSFDFQFVTSLNNECLFQHDIFCHPWFEEQFSSLSLAPTHVSKLD